MYLCVCATFNVEFLQRLPKQNKKEKKDWSVRENTSITKYLYNTNNNSIA